MSEADSIPFEVRADLPPPLTEEEEELAARSDWNGRELERLLSNGGIENGRPKSSVCGICSMGASAG